MRFRRALQVFAIILLILIVSLFIFRNSLLQWGYNRVKAKTYRSYGIHLSTAGVHFSGIDRITFIGLVVQPDLADTLLQINDLELNLSLSRLFTGQIGFDEIRANHIRVNAYNLDGRNNLRFKLKPGKQQKKESAAPDFLHRAHDVQKRIFQLLHTSFYASDIEIHYTDSAYTESIRVPLAAYDRTHLTALLIHQPSGDSMAVDGTVREKNKSYQLSIRQTGHTNFYLPFWKREQRLQCGFQSLMANITLEDQRDELQIVADGEVQNFQLHHWRLARDPVILPHTQFKGIWKISPNSIELDSSSVFSLQQVPVNLFANYTAATDTTFAFHLRMPETASDTFFHALPKGMFSTLAGISCTGTLAYALEFFINTREPDSLIFLSEMTKKNFRLNHYGVESYGRINQPFLYDAYDKQRFMRHVMVGPENPAFTPLGKMSDYLPKAVMQAEDPSFMRHRGFLPEAIRESIIKNYRQKRFARGGSTISMQLVKNVFLSRDKTISRKAEEALIVYLIENLGLVSKERMLEVYLNVIEWGPDVYGIGEASQFYFSKKPANLSLQESIFLASVIPSPKHFRYRFDKDGHLLPSQEGFFRILTARMASKGWISAQDTTGLLPEVTLKGPARHSFVPAESQEPFEMQISD